MTRLSSDELDAGAPKTIILSETREERIERIMWVLAHGVPGTKGLGPRDRANRLHAELERRIALAKSALGLK